MTTTTSTRTWSTEQTAIFAEFGNVASGNFIVRARAGTGKTTTIVEGIRYAPETSILLAAFNKRIAEELSARLSHPGAQAATLHSVGFRCVRNFWSGVRVANGTERADDLSEKVCGPTAPDSIKRLVSKLHTKGREIAPHATHLGDLTSIAINFECEPDEMWENTQYTLGYVETKALEAMELAATVKPVTTGIDFSDMIFLPVRNRWLTKQYDMVVVDEAQDMTNAQLEIAVGVCRGRVVVVGDDRQAIYAFRGADSGSLDRLKRELNAKELSLTTTYRCGKCITARAAEIVPDFRADDSNADGQITDLTFDKLVETVENGNFILSRLNAPLVSVAMSLLRNGKRARIAGADIGAGLKALVRKLKARSIPNLMDKLKAWEDKQVARLLAMGKNENAIVAVQDKAETLRMLAQDAKSVEEFTGKIDALFTDYGLGQAGIITCSSVHRSKGLEADTVFILAETLRSHNDEEMNIQYVAITRAKSHLVFVHAD